MCSCSDVKSMFLSSHICRRTWTNSCAAVLGLGLAGRWTVVLWSSTLMHHAANAPAKLPSEHGFSGLIFTV